MKNRIAYFDNAKAILIILVVFGHLLEQISFPNSKGIYLCIYGFHMPAFIFISGLCFKKGSGIKRLLSNYIIFQSLYLLCEIIEKKKSFQFSYTTPSWIMWYLLSMIIWYVLCEYLPCDKKRGIEILVFGIVLGLIVGYDKTIGRYLSLSRSIVFFSFFWSGVYIRAHYFEQFSAFISKKNTKNTLMKWCFLFISIVQIYVLFTYQTHIKKYWFYETSPYNDKGYTIVIRAWILLMAAVFSITFFFLIPKKEYAVLSRIGKNTLPVYLYHGILIKIADCCALFDKVRFPVLSICLLTCFLVTVLSMDPIGRYTKKNRFLTKRL